MPEWLLLLIEILFVATFVAGVAFIYWPGALLVAGVVGFLVCERQSAKQRADARNKKAEAGQ